ncbi:hypothetical protein DEU56DRAFT_302258 [Suillus clintonianus]|uniref:uncharacterized protein n=1 Tax=Suillus clintonianus TaxID=1904413 RepID=UPI001B862AF6|nr:uncharacterized protein DEU56DRAFT_302258 [Suillus clintonianus]KAG2139731.1 hypothetical protein DEU56DRAFT_302258 [Suillus clintonianus]
MDGYELDSFSPANRLVPNRALGVYLDQNSSHSVAPDGNRWQDHTSHEGNHRIFKYKQQVLSLVGGLLTVVKLSVLPLTAGAYLAFCIIANKRLIILKSDGFYSFTPDHIATIKVGVTSLNRLVVFAALYPVTDIVSKLQGEEFFRDLGSRRMRGVPLAILDRKSNQNYGFLRSLNDAFSRTCSIYMFLAFFTALICVAISWVAPASLNVATALVENELLALAVGALPAQGVYDTSITTPGIGWFDASENSVLACSVLWAEMVLGANYSFSVATSDAEFAAYIVPSPIDLPTTVSAHWMTDVVGINPSCEWASTNVSTIELTKNQSIYYSASASVHLQNLDLDVIMSTNDYSNGDRQAFNIAVKPFYVLYNHSTQGPPTDGSSVFIASQCSTGCIPAPLVLNLTDIPTVILDVNATTSAQAQTWQFAFLACRPNAVIQTREVVSNGTGFLEVLPVPQGKEYISQGNLHPAQTPIMLSIALGEISYAGPANQSTFSLGSDSTVQSNFLFGKEQIDNLPPPVGYDGPPIVVTILPTDTLARTFAGMLQSVSKSYLAGFSGTTYVPAKVFSPKVVFVSSMPFIITSAIMFGILFILVTIMHFRRHEKAFTLVSVSCALHGSNLPKDFALGGKSEALVADGDQRVVLQKDEDGTDVLQIIKQ